MKMRAVLDHAASSKVAYANPPDWAEMMAWRRLLKPSDSFIDVGSNVGASSLWAAGLGAASVIAVDPEAGAVALLQAEIAMNPWAIAEVVTAALGAKPGSMAFTAGLDTTNHLVTSGAGAQTEPVTTLDAILAGRTSAGAKVDVEGTERLVLQCATDSLASGRGAVFQLEWNSTSEGTLGKDRQPVAELLKSNGYGLFRPDEGGVLIPLSDEGYGADVFAVHPGPAAHGTSHLGA